MIAVLPALVRDLVDAWPLIVGAVALVGWLLRRQRAWVVEHISDPISELRRRQDTIGAEVTATTHLVRYHLGPNGTTKALHHRVADIERANGIEDS